MYAKLKNEYSALNVDYYQNLFIKIYPFLLINCHLIVFFVSEIYPYI